MIITKLTLGLGNNLFQYAFGRRLSLLNNTELKLYINDPLIVNYSKNLELDIFNIQKNIATEEEIKYFKKFERKKGKINFLHNIFLADESKYVKEKKSFNPALLKIGPEAYLEGYWVSEKYFLDIRDVLLQEFTPKTTDEYYQKVLEVINSTNSVAIHFRRGDYVTNPGVNRHHGVIGLDYYYQAMKLIEEKTKNPVYFIFSDDIDWVKNNLKTNRPVHYVKQDDLNGQSYEEFVRMSGSKTNIPTPKSFQELILMSKCQHNIIANSSFSWWGAWLNQNKNKIVISPKKWYNFNHRDINDIIPESWIKI